MVAYDFLKYFFDLILTNFSTILIASRIEQFENLPPPTLYISPLVGLL